MSISTENHVAELEERVRQLEEMIASDAIYRILDRLAAVESWIARRPGRKPGQTEQVIEQ